MQDLNKKMARGAAWMVLLRMIDRSIGLVSTMILARLLVPADFGLVALAMSMIAVLELLGTFGFDWAIIQNPNAERRHYDTAWTFNVLFGVFCTGLLVAVAHPVGLFYEEPRLATVMYVLALGSLVQGFENIGVVAYRKEMVFRKDFGFSLAKRLLVLATTISLALIWRNYWALVVGMVTGKCLGVLLSYIVHPYRPRLSLAARVDLFGFSKWLFINNILYFISNKSGDFIIGKAAGMHALGLYNVAYEISSLATKELIAPINRAVFPGYAKMAADPDMLRQGFLNVISMVALVALPAGTGIAATAHLIVPVILGPSWTDAVPVIQVLAFYGALTALQTNSWYVYLALAKPYAITIQVVVHIAVLLPLLFWWTLGHGTIGAAYAYVVSLAIVTPGVFWFLLRALKLRVGIFLRALFRPALASLAMYPAVTWLAGALPMTPIAILAVVIAWGALIYSGVVLVLWLLQGRPEGSESQVLKLLEAWVPRLGKAGR